MLDKNANVNAVGKKGYTPLHKAVEQGQLSVIKILLDSKADISAVTANNMTPRKLRASTKLVTSGCFQKLDIAIFGMLQQAEKQ